MYLFVYLLKGMIKEMNMANVTQKVVEKIPVLGKIKIPAPKKKKTVVIIGAFVNICLNYFLIPKYASVGAALASIIAECVIAIVQILLIYYGGSLFRTAGLNFKEFNFMMLLAISVIPFDWCRKYFFKRKKVNYGV